MAEIVLIRPGCTDFDEQHRIQGTLDLPLNARGQEEVDAIVDRLRESGLGVIYSPESEPARSTAEAISDCLDIPLKTSEHLRNFDQGLWEGLPIDDIRRKYPRVYKQWCDSPETICPPEGETLSDAVTRLKKALKKPMKKKQPVGIVASEPLASLISCLVEGREPEFPGPTCGCGDAPHVEFLRQNGRQHDGTVAAHSSTDEDRNE